MSFHATLPAAQVARSPRWVIALFAVLLALGPFLHGHIGASHLTGFHLDGTALSWGSVTPGNDTHDVFFTHPDDESPAVGVAASLPKSDEDTSGIAWIVGLVAGLGLALLAFGRAPQPAPGPLRVASHAAAEGWPPPALAPPATP